VEAAGEHHVQKCPRLVEADLGGDRPLVHLRRGLQSQEAVEVVDGVALIELTSVGVGVVESGSEAALMVAIGEVES
jgi:hypothetical protein